MIEHLQNVCKIALQSGVISVHTCERLLGYMESVRPVTPHAALRYRPIQRQLISAKSNWHRKCRFPIQLIKLSQKSK